MWLNICFIKHSKGLKPERETYVQMDFNPEIFTFFPVAYSINK